jgi:hypothetical protein
MMRPFSFWKKQIHQLDYYEKTFFRDMIKTLLSWDILRKEVLELEIILKILESDITFDKLNITEIRDVEHTSSIPEDFKHHHIPDLLKN